MSYGLSFYSISYQGLYSDLLEPSKEFREKIAETWKTVYAPDEGETYEAGLDEGLAELKNSIMERKNKLSTKGQLALVAAIEAGGQKLGTLEQPTGGGEEFRETFLMETAGKAFNMERFGEFVVSRGLFGFKSLEYPGWGGLLAAELAKLADVKLPPATGSEDFDEWLTELARIVAEAKETGKDLLTTYR